MHLFSSSQPDLNWDNPEVRDAVYDVVDFWGSKGTDGFRFDVINLVSKTPGLPDAPITEPDKTEQNAVSLYTNGYAILDIPPKEGINICSPNIHKYMHEMNRKVLSKYTNCTVGEMPCGVSEYEASEYVAKERQELSMVFQFDHMNLDGANGDKWQPRKWELWEFERHQRVWQQHMLGNHGWSSLYMENHDQARAVSRFGNPDARFRNELGTPHPQNWKIEDYNDVETQEFYKAKYNERKEKDPSKEPDMSDVMDVIRLKGRDNARTPMLWDNSENGGFTRPGTKPWLRLNEEYADINVQAQERDSDSVLSYFRQLLTLRKQQPVMFYGAYVPVNPTHPNIYAYLRTQGPWRSLTFCNWSSDYAELHLPEEIDTDLAVLLIANYDVGPEPLSHKTRLRPYEARIYSLRN
ncbi:Aamy [Aspergillus sclerotialis]|uniref:Aamy n=1 Tax=Aspergillus sclerotialis TaxID=2070753 RepID=A0A3A2ZV48_9EURO|nr:Aamy [Aspergillus sclerotialis]